MNRLSDSLVLPTVNDEDGRALSSRRRSSA